MAPEQVWKTRRDSIQVENLLPELEDAVEIRYANWIEARESKGTTYSVIDGSLRDESIIVPTPVSDSNTNEKT